MSRPTDSAFLDPHAADSFRGDPAAWRGAELLTREDYDVVLTAPEQEELVRAASRLDRAPSDLPLAGPRLRWIRERLETGSGVTRLRGLDLAGLDEGHCERLFLVLASQIGTPVSQTAAGERLLHVRDEGFSPGDARYRGPHSNRRLSFHTDRCDVIAFLCMRPAQTGGENEVVSSLSVYQELRARAPQALELLRQPFAYLRHTVDEANPSGYTMVPVFTVHQGRFAASFLRVLIDRADRSSEAPDLTDAQRSALDTLEAVAEDSALSIRFKLERGDVLFLNNWVTFHRRSAFADHPEPGRERHLLRLWLSVPNSRSLDPRFREHFGATEAGALRGGMRPA